MYFLCFCAIVLCSTNVIGLVKNEKFAEDVSKTFTTDEKFIVVNIFLSCSVGRTRIRSKLV